MHTDKKSKRSEINYLLIKGKKVGLQVKTNKLAGVIETNRLRSKCLVPKSKWCNRITLVLAADYITGISVTITFFKHLKLMCKGDAVITTLLLNRCNMLQYLNSYQIKLLN